jgi:hypothetical protein
MTNFPQGQAFGSPPQAAPPHRSGLAVASLVCGIAGLCTGGLAGIAGIVLGIIALRRIKASRGALSGRGVAIAGIIVGVIGLVLGLLLAGLGLLIVFRWEIKEWTVETWEKARQEAEESQGGQLPSSSELSPIPAPALGVPPGMAPRLFTRGY